MGIFANLQIFDRETRIEWHARRIQDPIKRLRYLREQGPGAAPNRFAEVWEQWLSQTQIGRSGSAAMGGMLVLAMLAVGIAIASGHAAWTHAETPQFRQMILPPAIQAPALARSGPSAIWLVETTASSEVYSNGLRIDTRFATANIARGAYRVFPPGQADLAHAEWLDQPAGIVFHTTESNVLPFVAEENRNLRLIGENVIAFVRQNHSYHYVVDRFGRVFRVVQETDAAFHAGPSVWADDKHVYVNLNASFLSVAFETQTKPGEGMPTATPAQIDAARILTDVLRARYAIPARNCVTHAQVSVNPANFGIGYHTDWADKFPFAELGLPDNYTEPPAALWAFGFGYAPSYVQSTGARLLPGLQLAELQVGAKAARLSLPLPAYRAKLERNYQEIIAAARSGESAKETAHEQ